MTPITTARRPSSSDLVHGFVAGAVGGVVGSGVKILGEMLYPPRPEHAVTPPGKLGDKLAKATAGHELTRTGEKVFAQTMHWTFGPLAAGIYGATVEAWPFAGVGYGTAFGTVLWALTHESTLPALGLSAPPTKASTDEQLSELFTHELYALTVEFVRRLIRGRQG